MRSGIGDGVVFGFRERVFGHWLILISCILTLWEVCENISHGNYPSTCVYFSPVRCAERLFCAFCRVSGRRQGGRVQLSTHLADQMRDRVGIAQYGVDAHVCIGSESVSRFLHCFAAGYFQDFPSGVFGFRD